MKLLDLFCGAGGAAMGYHRAGFEVVGVDIEPQPDYPFEFHQLDATALRRDVLNGCFHEYGPGSALPGRSDVCLGRFDAVHMSPPCQASSALTKGTNRGREYQQLIPAMREWAASTGLPTVLENVQGSDLRRDLTLCGEMFGLDVIRHRYFEVSGFTATQPEHKPHRGRVRGWRHGTYYDGPYVAVGDGGGKGSVAEWQAAMGIDWCSDRKSIAEAIPPSYTEHIGHQLAAHIRAKEAA
ncbi:DNA cytosine methyltransferase [uncultured Nocardioides sp.]|jgi:DNA (cytosine-5)-methyltransferase 1|uniref:DNA cytosine methyltransferase n=1 Tax=uncultured Nocardioides sp. TaxID=198441 RepID=UPI00261EA686|nr:DNA cytosine methyltransferase [uncultured Nocardioides sp.]HRD59350.1 DNA cytosine methyltransferase [Nocardioides sp.]